MVLRAKTGRSKGVETGRSKAIKLDGLKESKWTVPSAKNERSTGMELDGHTGTVLLVKSGFG